MQKRFIAQVAVVSAIVIIGTSTANIAFAKETNNSGWWGHRTWSSFVQKFEKKKESHKEERREEKNEHERGRGHGKGNHGGTSTPDTTAPVISNILVSSISTTSASVSWSTNEPASGKVFYSDGVTLKSKSGNTGVTAQTAPLVGLLASTTYEYVIVATDAAGNTATSSARTFTTLSNPVVPPPPPQDTTAPTFELLISGNVGTSTAQINWKTSEVAQSDLYFTDGINGQVRVASATSIFGFEQLKGLTPSTTYSFFVVAKDAAGNTGTSSTKTLTTLSLPTPPPTVQTTADFAGATLPFPGSWDIQPNVTVWQKNLQLGTRTGILSNIRFYASGTVALGDITNLHLMIDGIQYGATTSSAAAGSYVTFSSTINITPGSHIIKLIGDIAVGGQGKTASFVLKNVSDFTMVDGVNFLPVTPMVSGGPFIPIASGPLFINDIIAPIISGIVVDNISSTSARIHWQTNEAAFGKVRFSTGSPAWPTSTVASGLTNTTSQNVLLSNLTASTTYNFLIIATDAVGNTSTSSLGSFSTVPLSTQLLLMKYVGYADQSVAGAQTAFKVGDFQITAGPEEGVILNNAELKFTGIFPFSSTTDVYLVYGGTTSTVKASATGTLNFSLGNMMLPISTPTRIMVYASLPANSASGAFLSTLLNISGNGMISNTPISTGLVGGQVITVAGGIIAAQPDPSMPISSLVVGGTRVKVGSYRFTALNDSYTVNSLTAQTLSGLPTDAAAITDVVFKDGGIELATIPMVNGVATATGVSINIPTNSTKIIDAYVDISSIGTGGANSGANIGLRLTSYTAFNSGLVPETHPINIVGYSFYAYKSKPTITNIALPTTILTNGTQTIQKFSITADAGGPIAWRRISFIVASSSHMSYGKVVLFDDSAATNTPNVYCSPIWSNRIYCESISDVTVVGAKTYSLKADLVGTPLIGDSISSTIPSISSIVLAASYATIAASGLLSGASFIWSDESITPHSAASLDWNNDYLVKNLPTDSQTLTKL